MLKYVRKAPSAGCFVRAEYEDLLIFWLILYHVQRDNSDDNDGDSFIVNSIFPFRHKFHISLLFDRIFFPIILYYMECFSDSFSF